MKVGGGEAHSSQRGGGPWPLPLSYSPYHNFFYLPPTKLILFHQIFLFFQNQKQLQAGKKLLAPKPPDDDNESK